ncbi:MAG: nucleotidyltransferase domain-containing protein [Candidatus Pacearchaeota archaeon]|nr:nucleotidyltransferase domain-containing protein [Candidatus Pacearchaeota archaeon]
MTWKHCLKSLESISKKFFQDEKLFDIILYGSAVKGKDEPRDIDIVLIFFDRNIKERLEIAQDFKKKLPKALRLDIQTLNVKDFFDAGFFARQGILIEGYSLVSGMKFSKKLGFKGYSLFSYVLGNLNNSQKTLFTYSLIGRGKEEGMVKKVKGQSIGKGAFLVPIENSVLFEDFLEKWKIKYTKKNILVPI